MTNLRTWDAWHKVHQPFEIGWWKKSLAGGHPGLPTSVDEVRKFIDPTGAVIDIGCGPRPAFAPCTVIEPLVNEYKKITPHEWWEGITSYASPAEHFIDGLRGDTIICWNCINHAIGWVAILDNMLAYGNPGAKFAIATEFSDAFIGHPGFSRGDFMREIAERFSIRAEKTFALQLGLLMVAK